MPENQPKEHPHAVLVRDARLAIPQYGVGWLNSKITFRNGKPIAKPGLGTGSLDIIACINGHFVALDAKTGGATLSKEQRMFCDLVRRNGGIAQSFSSLDELHEILSSLRSAK